MILPNPNPWHDQLRGRAHARHVQAVSLRPGLLDPPVVRLQFLYGACAGLRRGTARAGAGRQPAHLGFSIHYPIVEYDHNVVVNLLGVPTDQFGSPDRPGRCSSGSKVRSPRAPRDTYTVAIRATTTDKSSSTRSLPTATTSAPCMGRWTTPRTPPRHRRHGGAGAPDQFQQPARVSEYQPASRPPRLGALGQPAARGPQQRSSNAPWSGPPRACCRSKRV